MRAANEINLKMAPLTPDHHFYIDQGANAHVRLVLIAIGEKLVEMGMLDQPDDTILLPLQRAARVHRRARSGRAAAPSWRPLEPSAPPPTRIRPQDWVGTVTATQLAFPYLNLWGFPDKFNRPREMDSDKIVGIGGSPGVVEGIARVVMSTDEFDSLVPGEILVCEMTNPAWQVLYGKIIAVVTNAGDLVAHPAVLAREYEIPAVVGTSVGTYRIKTGDRIRVDGNAGVVEILERRCAVPGRRRSMRPRHGARGRDHPQRPQRPGQGSPPRGDP